MQFLLIVLNKVELLDTLLEQFVEHGVDGATILNSKGMVRELAAHNEDYPIFGPLRFLIDLDRQESKTIFTVVRDEKVEEIKEVVRQVIGDLSLPDTAVMFTLPVLSVEGVDL
jgi:nitrogen regulatory protein P-II 1